MEPKHFVPANQVRAMPLQSSEPVLNGTVQNQLGRRLRVMFDGPTAPMPDRFQELLAEIDRKVGKTDP